METKEWTNVNKSKWGDGPWQSEPDKMQFPDEATGLPCLIVRNNSGALCGYVGVPEGHPAYKKHYDDVSADVHGGLTFSDQCRPGKEEENICHIPSAGESDNVWWLGFDCIHAGDFGPAFDRLMAAVSGRTPLWGNRETYKTVKYVKREIKQLAAQLAAM